MSVEQKTMSQTPVDSTQMPLLMRVFVTLVILVAATVGLIVLYAPREMLVKIIVFRDFFDSALPILAFGALIKYLCLDWKK